MKGSDFPWLCGYVSLMEGTWSVAFVKRPRISHTNPLNDPPKHRRGAAEQPGNSAMVKWLVEREKL